MLLAEDAKQETAESLPDDPQFDEHISQQRALSQLPDKTVYGRFQFRAVLAKGPADPAAGIYSQILVNL